MTNLDFTDAMRDARDFASKHNLTLEQASELSAILDRIGESHNASIVIAAAVATVIDKS